MKLGLLAFLLSLSSIPVLAEQYTISTYAGGAGLPTPVLAAKTPLGYPSGVAVDSKGVVYFSTTNSSTSGVFKIDPAGMLCAVAGTGRIGFSGDGGAALDAQLTNPHGLAFDALGNLFIADSGNYRIRKVSTDGTISTVAGNGTRGYSGDGGAATNATLFGPSSLAFDSAGNLYIAENGNLVIRKVTPDGIISTVAGNGKSNFSGDGGPAIQAGMFPNGIAVDEAGNLYIADRSNNRIRKIRPDGIIVTIAGGGQGFGDSGDGGPAANSTLLPPQAVAVDGSGVVYIVETNGIRTIATDGSISTFAGGLTSRMFNGLTASALDSRGDLFLTQTLPAHVFTVSAAGEVTLIAGNGNLFNPGDDGPATGSQLNMPEGLTLDALGNLYIADYGTGLIHEVTADGVITTVATVAGQPASVAVDTSGNIYYSDSSAYVMRVSPAGSITTLVGGGRSGLGDGGASFSAQLKYPSGLALDASGNLYIADAGNFRIRKVDKDGIITTVAGNGKPGTSGDGGPAVDASLLSPSALAVGADGSLFIVDSGNIRRVGPDGVISRLAGVTASMLASGLAVDSTGNIFVADSRAAVVRKISADGSVTTIAGMGASGYSGDGGPALNAAMWSPFGVAVDATGRVFVSDSTAGAVRVLTPSSIAIP